MLNQLNFPNEECYITSAVSKTWKTFVHRDIRQPNGAQSFRRLAHVKRHLPKQFYFLVILNVCKCISFDLCKD